LGTLGLGLALCTVLGCGARTDLVFEDDDRTKTAAPKNADNSTPRPGEVVTPSDDNAGPAGNSPFTFDSEALPPCELGRPRSGSGRCKFVYENRCYDKALEACACACPADRTDTFCAQGLTDEFGSIPIKYCDVL
jgi:hypothetical protein